MGVNRRPVELFYSYAHEDEGLRDELEQHLKHLQNQGFIKNWHDREIAAGKDWRHEIEKHLEAADIILLLVSVDFMASEFILSVELQRALQRHKADSARVIPVILRPCDWRGAPFGKLQALPRDGKPVTEWKNPEVAFADIAKGIQRVVRSLTTGSIPTAPWWQLTPGRKFPVVPAALGIGLLVLAIFVYYQLMAPHEDCIHVGPTITQPEQREKVSHPIEVLGEVENLPRKTVLWLLVYDRNLAKVFSVSQPTVDRTDNWRATASLVGSSVGSLVTLKVILADRKSHLALTEFHKTKEVPPGVRICTEISVFVRQ